MTARLRPPAGRTWDDRPPAGRPMIARLREVR